MALGDGVRRHLPSSSPKDAPFSKEGPSPELLTRALRERALALGFVRFGVSLRRRYLVETDELEQFLDAGRHGGMAYLAERDADGRLLRSDPGNVVSEVRSVVSVALRYGGPSKRGIVPTTRLTRAAVLTKDPVGEAPELVGRVAGYAGGTDYHHLFKERLLRLADELAELAGHPIEARPAVDTAPLFERQLARDAGLAFIGKNTLAIAPGAGSYVLLGQLLTRQRLAPTSDARVPEGCGECQSCLEACPTGALDAAYRIDARRCISYLTIESSEDVPEQLRSAIGDRVFGCDECQVVCPYNQSDKAPEAEPELQKSEYWAAPRLVDLLFATSSGHRKHVRGTALRRASREQLARNAAIALGNSADVRAVAPLGRALHEHFSEQVQRHAAWGLGQLWQAHQLHEAQAALREHLDHEKTSVRLAVRRALSAPAERTTPQSDRNE